MCIEVLWPMCKRFYLTLAELTKKTKNLQEENNPVEGETKVRRKGE